MWVKAGKESRAEGCGGWRDGGTLDLRLVADRSITSHLPEFCTSFK